jgi:hypothetical protein
MSTTPAAEELTVTLPRDVADLVRAEVASGKFANPVDDLSHVVHADIAREAATLPTRPISSRQTRFGRPLPRD